MELTDPRPQGVSTPKAAAPVAAYSQAVRMGAHLYLSGQIGLRADEAALVEGGVRAELPQVFANMANILEAAGSGLADVLSLTVYLTDPDDFAALNEAYAQVDWAAPPPARTTVIVQALPLGAAVEITAVAFAAPAPTRPARAKITRGRVAGGLHE